jgi:hypothetical protein
VPKVHVWGALCEGVATSAVRRSTTQGEGTRGGLVKAQYLKFSHILYSVTHHAAAEENNMWHVAVAALYHLWKKNGPTRSGRPSRTRSRSQPRSRR